MDQRADQHPDFDGGHADARSDHAEQQEKCCRATFVERADAAVAVLNELAAGAKATFLRQSKQVLLTTVCMVYGAINEIEAANNGAQFLADRGVTPHGNNKNPYQPYVLAFTKGTPAWARSSVCKYAQVIAVARNRQILPERFEAWLKTRTIDQIRAEFRSMLTERCKAERDALVGKVLVDPELEPEKAPVLPGTPITIGHAGLKLAAIKILDRERGDFRVIGILPHGPNAVMEIILKAAEAAAQAGEKSE